MFTWCLHTVQSLKACYALKRWYWKWYWFSWQKTFIFMYLVKAVPPSLKWVFSRNPTETGYADKEIFTCIGSLPASLQPVLAQVCSYPKVLSPSFSPTQSIRRRSLFMFWRRRPVSFVVNVSVKISIIHGFTDWFIFFSPAKQLSSAPPFLVISFWNKLCTVFWLLSSFLTTPKSM